MCVDDVLETENSNLDCDIALPSIRSCGCVSKVPCDCGRSTRVRSPAGYSALCRWNPSRSTTFGVDLETLAWIWTSFARVVYFTHHQLWPVLLEK